MQIGIIGYGYVGSAVSWAHNNDELLINDPSLKESTPLEKFVSCDAVFICVPSPSTDDGHCDTSILEDVLSKLEVHESVPLISKVTAPPNIYEKLQEQYPNLVHAPEFLTAKNSVKDYMSPHLIVVGGHETFADAASNIIASAVDTSRAEILITDIKSAALFKYMMNSYLATKVTFMNDFFNLAQAENIDWKEICDIAQFDKRIGSSHMGVPGNNGEFGWAGACFPKDIDAIINYAKDKNISFDFLKSVKEVNKKHRSKNK